SGYALLEKPQSTTALKAARVAKNRCLPVVLDIVPHRVFTLGVNNEYNQCLSIADGIVLELNTARRLFECPNEPKAEVLRKALEVYSIVILRPSNDIQIVATRSASESMATGYSDAHEKTGFLDRLTAKTLF